MSVLDITAYGASPGISDNAAAIQSAIDAAQIGDIVRVSPGVFMVSGERLRGRSGIDLQIDGWLRAIPGTASIYRVLVYESVVNSHIKGSGGIIGDRAGGRAPEDMQAHGLAIYGSDQIVVTGITAQNARGDNFYLSGVTNTTIQNCLGQNAMRNNLSIIDAEVVNIIDNTFVGASGPAPMPMAGIDLEPDRPDQRLINILITRNKFLRNKGPGVFFAMGNTQNVHKVHVYANQFDQHYKDGSGPPTSGINTPLCNFFYAVARWMPGYDYWYWPREHTVP